MAKKPAKGKAKAKPERQVKAKLRAAKAKPKVKPKAKPATRQPARAKTKAKATPKRKAAPKPKPRAARVAVEAPEELVPEAIQEPASDAVPQSIGFESSSDSAPRSSLTARERMMRSSPVVEILDDPHPIGALRRFLDSIKGEATSQQAQIALGSAQLMLQPLEREHRGGSEVKELVDLMLHHWTDFGERRKGFHAQEFLKHALAGVGVDRERIIKLQELIPQKASAELLFTLACAHAVARDKVAMLDAVEDALEAGITAAQFRRDNDFLAYVNDPDLEALLSHAEVPAIPVDVDPYLPAVRDALDLVLATLKEFGEPIELRPPVRLDAILDAERARKISLPNDYRALLTMTNGMMLWEHSFFGAGDYREATPLAVRAKRYIEHAASLGVVGIQDCVPLANWGQPDDWLLYDPHGRIRGGGPGYVLRLNSEDLAIRDLAAALTRLEFLARETLGTN